MKTTIKSYFFDTRNADGLAKYKELESNLKSQGLKCFETHGGDSHYKSQFSDGLVVDLETTHLFNNQWNTAPIEGISDKGLRVFDWAQDYPSNLSGCPPYIKRGHYLIQTDEMREIRRNTSECGYCGKQEPMQKGYVFCPHCLDSEYLDSDSLHLTRMQAVDDKSDRAALSEAEKAHLLPLWKDAKLHGSTVRGKTRIAKMRADIISKHDKAIKTAETELKGFTWLMDNGINPDNAIYYSHTGRFGFGWRSPVDGELLSNLLGCIGEFPFSYDIKCADGRTLSGN